ncbi:MAG: hypothetical protein NTV28_01260 [Propionibacteriales bacterium]|nr:hypothetical protein [Propionibacteriales bacterium]
MKQRIPSRTLGLGLSAAAITASLALAVSTPSTAAPAHESRPASPAATADLHKVHVNSTGSTRLFATPNGEAYYGWLAPCTNFYRDTIVNGRYHSPDLGGYVSTDKAGPGWCGD